MNNLLDRGANDNSEAPTWLVLHGGIGAQRRRWGADMAQLADDLVRHGWVTWREGKEAHVKHRAMMAN